MIHTEVPFVKKMPLVSFCFVLPISGSWGRGGTAYCQMNGGAEDPPKPALVPRLVWSQRDRGFLSPERRGTSQTGRQAQDALDRWTEVGLHGGKENRKREDGSRAFSPGEALFPPPHCSASQSPGPWWWGGVCMWPGRRAGGGGPLTCMSTSHHLLTWGTTIVHFICSLG